MTKLNCIKSKQLGFNQSMCHRPGKDVGKTITFNNSMAEEIIKAEGKELTVESRIVLVCYQTTKRQRPITVA
jgi:hypothetical protein